GIRDDLVTGVQTCALPISQLAEIGLGHSERHRPTEPNTSIRSYNTPECLLRVLLRVINQTGETVAQKQLLPVSLCLRQKRQQHEIGRASCRERVKESEKVE